MTQGNMENIVEVKANANVYTVLLAIAIFALSVSTFLVGSFLMAPAPEGYGMEMGDFFKPYAEYKKEVDAQAGALPDPVAARR